MRNINTLVSIAFGLLAQPALAQYAPPADQAPAASYDRLEQYLWDGAVRKNTPDAYQTYLRRYPESAHSDQARAALDRFYGRAPAQPYSQPPAAPQQGYPPQPQAYPPQSYPPQAYPQAAPAAPAPVYSPAAPAPASQGYPTTAQPAAPAYPPQAYPAAAVPAPVPAAPVPTSEPAPAAPPPAENAPAAAASAPVADAPAPAPAPAATPKVAGSPLFLCRPVFPGGTPPFEQAGEAELTAYLQALKVNSVPAYQTYLQAWPHGLFAPAVTELVATREGRAKALAAATVPGPSQAHPRTPVTIAPADYPAGATGAGSATAIWEVAEDGCVQYCRVEKSSGSVALDAATCRILSARGSYEPARDSAGKPMRAIETGTFSWTAPAK